MKTSKYPSSKKDVYQLVTDHILEQLEKGTIPWHKPWSIVKPFNYKTKKEYRGVNTILLAGAVDPRFMTINQVNELGGRVKKGAKSHIVVFWSPSKPKLVEVESDDGKKETMIDGKTLGGFILKYYRVFCAADIEGIDFPPLANNNTIFNPIEEAEKIWAEYPNRPSLDFGGNRACYIPSRDHIQMPNKEVFEGVDEYYSTFFHEMGHSTGHQTRLNRKGITEFDGFGSHQYSYEELVAEMTAAFLCAHAGITNTVDNSVAYIKSWSKKLKEDKKMILQAASQAQKAADYILKDKAFQEIDEDNSESVA